MGGLKRTFSYTLCDNFILIVQMTKSKLFRAPLPAFSFLIACKLLLFRSFAFLNLFIGFMIYLL